MHIVPVFFHAIGSKKVTICIWKRPACVIPIAEPVIATVELYMGSIEVETPESDKSGYSIFSTRCASYIAYNTELLKK